MADVGKTISDEEVQRLKNELQSADEVISELQRENKKLKDEVEKVG